MCMGQRDGQTDGSQHYLMPALYNTVRHNNHLVPAVNYNAQNMKSTMHSFGRHLANALKAKLSS